MATTAWKAGGTAGLFSHRGPLKVQGLPFQFRVGQWMRVNYKSGVNSIIIPTYNRGHLLRETLNSVHAQTYRPLEVIIVDDGSTDDTATVVENWRRAFAIDDLDIKYLQQENQGANAARNLGLVESSGEFIQFLDSDDVLHPQQTEALVRALRESPVCDLAWSEQVNAAEIPETFRDKINVSGAVPPEIQTVTTNPMIFPKNRGSVLLRRQLCLDAGPWDETLIRWQDMEYMFRVAALRPSCRFVDAPLYLLREHSHGRIKDLYEQEIGIEGGLEALACVEQIIMDAEQDHEEARYCVARYYLGLAKLAMKMGSQEQVRRALDGAHRQGPSKRFALQLRIVRLAHALLGPFLTRRILEAYTYARAS